MSDDTRYNIEQVHHESILIRLDNMSEARPNGCVEWTGQIRSSGYGGIRVLGKVLLAHRLVFFIKKRSLNEDEVVRHTCNNRLCINPEHLEAGSVAQNNNDKILAGTMITNAELIRDVKVRLYSYIFQHPETNEIIHGHVKYAESINVCPKRFKQCLEQSLPIKDKIYKVLQRPLCSPRQGDIIGFKDTGLLKEKIKRLVDINEKDCWEWIAGKTYSGYGNIIVEGKSFPAHKASYIAHNGFFDNELVVRHKCHNKSCVNPKHLILGTDKENAADNIAAGKIVTNSAKQSASRSKSYGLAIEEIETGKLFYGLKALAKTLGTSSKTLKRKIDKGEKVNGRTYVIMKPPSIEVPVKLITKSGRDNPMSKSVICIDTGEVFDTVTSAAKKLNVTTGALAEAIKTNRKCAGKHWAFDTPNAIRDFKPKENEWYKKVKRLDTGEVYFSMKAAAAAIKRKSGNIGRVLDKPGSKCGGTEWVTVED